MTNGRAVATPVQPGVDQRTEQKSGGPEEPREVTCATMQEIEWYHRIDLGNGLVTPGSRDNFGQLARLGIPENLSGKRVLDIGTRDGFFAFLAEERGADSVLAIDKASYRKTPGEPLDWNQEWRPKPEPGFVFAREVLGSRAEFAELDIYDADPDDIGTFDLVLCLGLLYHLPYPLEALEIARKLTAPGGLTIVETASDMNFHRRPAMAFYPGAELNRDPGNWFGFNAAAVESMMRTAGFSRTEVIWESRLSRRIASATKGWLQRRRNFLNTLQQGRVVVHGWA